jgi:hypothetical protein
MRMLPPRIRELVAEGRLRVSAHGFEELLNDDISLAWLIAGLPGATQVEEYPDYHKGPCVLTLHGIVDRQPVHALWGIARDAQDLATLITAYRPDPDGWKTVRFVHADRYAAEVEVELVPDDGAWGPYLSSQDALKLERVRAALKRGDIAAATREARVFELMPLSA